MISDIINKLDPMGSNETSLLLAMTIIMLRKSVKLNVISMRSCVRPSYDRNKEAVILAQNLTECFPRLQRR